jgi:hypothetical protein
MSLAENAFNISLFDGLWDEPPTVPDEGATRLAKRAALVRKARHYVDQFMAVGALDGTAQDGIEAVTIADDIAFGRSDCDFVFRD